MALTTNLNNNKRLGVAGTVKATISTIGDVIRVFLDALKVIVEITRDLLSSTVALYQKISSQLEGVVDDIANVTNFIINIVRASFGYVGGLTSPLSELSKDGAYAKGKEHINALLDDTDTESK